MNDGTAVNSMPPEDAPPVELVSATNEKSPRISRRAVKCILLPIIFFVIIPLLLAAGVWLFGDRSYNIVAAAVALLACFPFFFAFEKRQKTSRELMVIAVMTGISVLGRFIFAPVPGFKPVTAIVIIAAISLGGEAGFIIGALSAVVSNIYFGQGPWTPFQMFSWGTLGFLAGLLPRTGLLKKGWTRYIMLSVIGIIGGALYSVMMNVWVILSFDGTHSMAFFWTAMLAALPAMGLYAASNVIFLLLLEKPVNKKLERIKIKYEIFLPSSVKRQKTKRGNSMEKKSVGICV